MPYLSVIVPIFNAEKSIERCIDSIVNQSFGDMEIILVDDGSKDKSGEICDKLAESDSRIKMIHKENAGASAARNTGLQEAAGEYILFVDSDDYLPIFYVEELVQAQKKYGENAFVWTALQIVSENGAIKEEKFSYASEECSVAERKDILKFSGCYILNSPVNKLYHSSVIGRHNLRMAENLSIAEDLLFNLTYLEAAGDCPVVVLNRIPYYYVRNGETSLDHGYQKNYYRIHRAVLDVLWKDALKWQAPEKDIPLFYERYWEYMQNAFANLEYNNCPLSGLEKFWEKSRITADKHFQKSLMQRKAAMGRGSYLMWRSRIYALVWLYEKIRGNTKKWLV